ncbi:negative transcriptional regulator, PaiB family [Pseudooceanicola antarcticus]|uniref:FMN-binding negative transcriptional regulator n=1 Tax=Pseudooceanicola antarcticus TaxID=1247613 RepID=A0A285HWT2_9RHOB|nr:FMN-binding negative transcriptional regulator [Pseudooceanicola antarcticus]PJE27374.1 FMN-binding negative transcriptional regulator [Pseudooceanicola antarcticus]SNY40192.1 negative transcriptional regulator, PaiB family [Pseudooceanicola antarcticus]
MHPNPIYRQADDALNLAFAARQGAGLLCLSADGAPLAAQTPFVIRDGHAFLHLVRSNPVARAAPGPARLIVTGPQGYVSPDWYGMEHQVPTWNYVSVHLLGQLEPLPQGELRHVLDMLSEEFETRLLPKPAWTADKMPAEAMERLMRMIQPFRLHIDSIEGTWKLAQNKPEEARLAAAEGLAAGHTGLDLAELAALMRDPPA